MNMQFMPQNQFNPYSDNPQFVKKIFTAKKLSIITGAIAVMLISIIFEIFYTASLFDNGNFLHSQQDLLLYNAFISFMIIVLIGITLILALCFLGFVIMTANSLDKTSFLFPKSAVIFEIIFFFAAMIISSITLLFFFSNVILPIFIPSQNSITVVHGTIYYITIFFETAAMVLLILWSIFGAVFFQSILKTINCKGIYSSGSKGFSASSYIMAIISFFAALFVMIAFFIIEPQEEITIITDIQTLNLSAAVFLAIFFAAAGTALLVWGRISKKFNTACSQALHSITYNGANYYVSNQSSAAAYYQSNYNSPTDDNSNPPTSVK